MIASQSHRDLDSGTTAAPHVSVSASHFELREPRSVSVGQITLRFRNAALQRSNVARCSTRKFESVVSIADLSATTSLALNSWNYVTRPKDEQRVSDATPIHFWRSCWGLPNYRADTWTIR